MKVFFRTIHLYLSLAAGIIIFCSCFTGTMLVFEKEIQHALHPQRYAIKPEGNRMALANLVPTALKQVPKAKLSSVMVYNDPEHATEIAVSIPEKKKNDAEMPAPKAGKSEKGHDHKDKKPKADEKPNITLFVNPYTGQVMEQFNRRQTFMYKVEMFHRFLLGAKNSLGDWIISLSTLIFLFILITGVILWWPKTKAIMRQRLKIKWDGSTKRLTHDLHIVTGFYTSIFLIIVVLTGLIMTFKWANVALFAITGSKPPVKEQSKVPLSVYKPDTPALSADVILADMGKTITSAEYYSVRLPRDSSATYTVNVWPEGAIETTADVYYIDQYSGGLVGSQTFASKSLGQRVRAYVKPVHTGAVYGLPTKILSFVVCALSLIFPVTGVMMWLNRTKKKKPRTKTLVVA
ncbi:PepSY-associated TM helix domain-containing protein [Mucilaginibacter lappiensis]|uniref:Putative iron-regulated membrane protein n=1 Tax=Mucilaginibacter lappiensis TaxID=354630 RepID=A0A841JHF3_9SPHI|nr:PepSY-associated TM helix domain-containing protein [Mucilaginibacter lappiensis]MBB6128078.1 putative iron-regulated membrane protein [Mucilaginibacter lappiensis]